MLTVTDVVASLERVSEGRTRAVLRPLLFVLAVLALFAALYQLPDYGDWSRVYYKALRLPSPYDHPHFMNPPWLLPLIAPFGWLPVKLSGALWTAAAVIMLGYAAIRLGAGRLGLLLLFLNPFFWMFITLGQLEGLLLLGLILPGQGPWAVLLMAIKPHVLAPAILLKLRSYRPVDALALGAAVALSLLIWPSWPARMLDNWGVILLSPLSLDVFPFGVPAGLALAAYAWRRRDLRLAGLSGFFLSPYVGIASMTVYLALVFAAAPTWLRLLVFVLAWVLGLWLIL